MRPEAEPARAPSATVRLSGAIMAHPSRLDAARRLQRSCPELELTVVIDPEPDAGPSSLRTSRLAWSAVAPDATHHLVLQDDARLSRMFARELSAVVRARPTHALSLFTEWGSRSSYAIRLAALTGSSWAEVIDSYAPSVGLVLPADLAREFGSGSGGQTAKDDVELHGFLAGRGIPGCLPVAGLVDHADTRSLTGNGLLGPRRSACFTDDLGLGLDLDLDLPEPALIPYFDPERARPACAGARVPGRVNRKHRALSQFLAAHDLEAAELSVLVSRGLRSAALDRVPAARPVLSGLWITAFALGVQARSVVGPSPPAEQIMRRPQVRRSLGTMADGALFLSMRTMAGQVAPTATRMILDAVCAGLDRSGS